MPARLILAGLALAAGLSGLAGPSAAAGAAGPSGAERRDAVDESALRYYAALKQAARVEAETRRLQRRHPGWQPPADLWTAAQVRPDEAPLWDLLAAGRQDELRAAIAARRAAETGWRPSPALSEKLRLVELRQGILADARQGRWARVAEVGAREGAAFPGDVELLWLFAEGASRTERPAEAAAILRGVIELPSATRQERLATIQKTLALLPMAEAEPLIARAAALRGADDLAPVARDLTRARLSAALADRPGAEVTAEALRDLADGARAAEGPGDASLLAWAAYRNRANDEALDWFKLAIARGGDAMVAHGLAHTLRRLGRRREAEEVAYAWREPLVNNAILYVDLVETEMTRDPPPPIEPERVNRFAQHVLATASGEGAQAIAWYSHNTCQFETSLEWFRRAVAWFPKEATVLGYAVTLRRLKRQREFVEVVNRYDGLFPTVVGLLFDARDTRPLACEEARPAPTRIAAAGEGPFLDLAGPVAPAPARPGWVRIPVPGQAEAGGTAAPLVRRSEFPIAVGMENDLRFGAAAAGQPGIRPALPPLSGRGGAPGDLVARRVPGVGPMPYERFGFALLPAWNGRAAASAPVAAELPPPAGTLWAAERTLGETAPRPASPAEPEAGGGRPVATISRP